MGGREGGREGRTLTTACHRQPLTPPVSGCDDGVIREAMCGEKALSLVVSKCQQYSERVADPISCPIGEVVNFLAHLFEQGYQYKV